MLARPNRVITGDEFRTTVRRGSRVTTGLAVYHVRVINPGAPARFGVVVSRAVGGAVERNRVRRRFRAVARELVDGGAAGADVVVRALPASARASWTELRDDELAALRPRLSSDAGENRLVTA